MRDEVIGFIGIGTMGYPMADHLVQAGHKLVVADVSDAAIAPLLDQGATRADTPAAVAQAARITFLSLPGPAQVDAVVSGADGLLSTAQDGDIIVDLSTNAHATVEALSKEAAAKGIAFVDAPVSGGKVGAEKGTLAIMAGGSAAAMADVTPLMTHFAENIFHVGDSGMGTIAKLVNNQILLSCAVTLQEGFTMAAKAGLDSTRLLEIIKKSSAAGHMGMAPLLLSRKFDDVLFQLAIAKKDLAVALQSAEALGVDMPTTAAAVSVYEAAIEAGLGDKVFFATQKVLEDRAGTEVERPRRPEKKQE